MARPVWVAVFAVVAGCWSPPPAHPSAALPSSDRPACTPELRTELEPTTTGRLLLDGRDLHLPVDQEEGKSDGAAVVYPDGSDSVLLAWTTHGHYGRPNGTDTLYRVDCRARTATAVAHLDGADFGHSARTRDGAAIYFSALGGVRALDVATRQIRRVTQPVELHDCGDRGPALGSDGVTEVPRIALDAVDSLADDDGVLIYEDGDNCGFEGDWTGTTYYLDHPERPGGQPYLPTPVGPIAADAGGALYAITAGVVWRTLDRGDHWQRVDLPAATTGDDAPSELFADAHRAGHVLVVTTTPGPGPFLLTSRLLATRDGGRTWTELDVPPYDNAFQLQIALRDDDLDHPRAWGNAHRDDGSTGDVAWEWSASDAWTELDPAPAPPAASPAHAVRLGDTTFTPSDNGLLRRRANQAKPDALFPK